MTIPATGVLWLSWIRDEFRPGAAVFDMYSYYRDHGPTVITRNPENAAIPNTGQALYFSYYRGTYKSYAGSWDKRDNYTGSITIPSYYTLRMRVWGAGAGGSALYNNVQYTGGSGGLSRVKNASTGGTYLTGNGGIANLQHGTASGGNDANVTGGGSNGGVGKGGGWNGGDGGFADSSFGASTGKTFDVTVGNGGARGNFSVPGIGYPTAGTDGRVLVEWGV